MAKKKRLKGYTTRYTEAPPRDRFGFEVVGPYGKVIARTQTRYAADRVRRALEATKFEEAILQGITI